jgi:hypothetical protein
MIDAANLGLMVSRQHKLERWSELEKLFVERPHEHRLAACQRLDQRLFELHPALGLGSPHKARTRQAREVGCRLRSRSLLIARKRFKSDRCAVRPMIRAMTSTNVDLQFAPVP